MSKRNHSTVWNYFTKQSDEISVCGKCAKTLCCKGSSTTSMINHLKLKHNINILKTNHKESTVPVVKSTNSATSILKYIKRQKLNEIVARLFAEDGFTVNGITRSSFIRQSLSQRGFSLPANPTGVMNLVLSYSKEIQTEIKSCLSDAKKSGARFSLTLDEWSSLANKRYFNVNIHSQSLFFNLGLIYIPGEYYINVFFYFFHNNSYRKVWFTRISTACNKTPRRLWY
jgi:hypothetical protein